MTVISISTKYKNLPRSYRKYYEKGAEILANRKEKRETQIRTALTLGLAIISSLTVLLVALFL